MHLKMGSKLGGLSPSSTAPPSNDDIDQTRSKSMSNSECDPSSNGIPDDDVKERMEKKPSPSKAHDTAVEPSEGAHMVNVVNGETVLNGTYSDEDNVEKTMKKDVEDDPSTSTELEGIEKVDPSESTSTKASDTTQQEEQHLVKMENKQDSSELSSEKLITNDMLLEEQQLKEHSDEAEEKIKKEQEEYLKNMDDDSRKVRYQRLQVLLDKCNAYTQYLLKRIKKQEELDARNNKLISQFKARQDRRKEEKLRMAKQSDEISTDESKDQSIAESTQSSKKRPLSDSLESPDCKKSKLSDDAKDSCAETKEGDQLDEDADIPEKCSEEDSALDELCNRKINGEVVPISQPLLLEGGVLRPYQIDGYNWLVMLYENGVNGILADEMGLGKTVQCISLIAHLASMGVRGPFLVIGPLSTVPNWVAEFERFTPQLPVILYHGDKHTRAALRKKMLKLKKINDKVIVSPVVVTSYEIIMADRKYLKNILWKYLIVDEGQRIKNTHCRLITDLRLYNTTHRLLLTGTPLQNSLSELWSLLNFLLPELFDDLASFESWFDIESISHENSAERIMATEQRDHILSMLHQILTPFMLRRLKTDVELKIPPKKEIMVFCPLSKTQQIFYKATLDRTIEEHFEKKLQKPVKVETDDQGRPVRQSKKVKVDYKSMCGDLTPEKKGWSARDEKNLMKWINNVIDAQTKREERAPTPKSSQARNSQVKLTMKCIMMMLRKICNHPYLIEHPLDPKTGELLLTEDLVKQCGKMLMLDQMLPELKKTGHKVLIFSQFTKVLNLLEDYCYLRNYEYSRLDGSYGFEQRQEQINSFNKDPNTFLFLISTRAGGLGINLVAADTVIIYDSDWNPQCDLQAQDRCHRIGQVKPVVVYRLVTRNTIDQRIVERATAKRKLEKMIIHKGKFKCGIKNFSTSLTAMSPQELLELLNSTDHKETYEGENPSTVISRKDLLKMLDRSDLMDKTTEDKNGRKKKNSKKTTSCSEIEGVFKVIETEAEESPAKLSNITDLKEDDSDSKSSTDC